MNQINKRIKFNNKKVDNNYLEKLEIRDYTTHII